MDATNRAGGQAIAETSRVRLRLEVRRIHPGQSATNWLQKLGDLEGR